MAALSHYCGDVHLAEELAQEALVRACRRWERVSQFESPEGWTYRVAVNLANSMFRRRRAERRARERHGVTADRHRDADVADQLTVHRALEELSAKQREAVILRYFLDLSADEAGRIMGSNAGAVRALTHRAVRQLRGVMDVTVPADEEAADVS